MDLISFANHPHFLSQLGFIHSFSVITFLIALILAWLSHTYQNVILASYKQLNDANSFSNLSF